MKKSLFYYDSQIKRFLTQFIRLLSGFQYQSGVDASGHKSLATIPIRYASTNRQVAQVMKNNSENGLNTVPAMVMYITELKYSRERVQDPTFIGAMHLREREFDEATGEYTTRQGSGYTVERMMPVPFDLTISVDLWTSNHEQKFQILEQMLVLFNPAVELQNTQNFIDWTSLTWIELKDVTYSSRTIPVGAEDSIDVATLSFELPIWLSPPVKLKNLGVIETIVANIFTEAGDISDDITTGDFLTRIYVTPTDMGLLLLNGEAKLLDKYENVTAPNDSLTVPSKLRDDVPWINFIDLYGRLRNGISQLRIVTESGSEVIGTVAEHPTDSSILLFNVDADTIPSNTLEPVDAIIDPQQKGPSSNLPAAATGQRYLIVDNIGEDTAAWGLNANANDIIEYNGTSWVVALDSQDSTASHYVTNITTNIQYKWNTTAKQWVKSYEGEYRPGEWRLVL